MPVDQIPEHAEARALSLSPSAANQAAKCSVDLSYATAVQSTPRGGCVFCCYEITGRGVCPVVARAVVAMPTSRGVRDLCAAHAEPFFVPRWDILPAVVAPYAAVQARPVTDACVRGEAP